MSQFLMVGAADVDEGSLSPVVVFYPLPSTLNLLSSCDTRFGKFVLNVRLKEKKRR